MSDRNRVLVKKKGFSFLSFFLGILIGIIILAGALFGVGYFAVTADLDKVMSAVGLPNRDENGNNKYVNTDADNGGVKNALQLLQRITEMARNSGSMTLGQLEDILPVAGGLTEKLSQSFSKYAPIDEEELKQVKFSEFGAYVNELVMEIRPAALISGEMNRFAKLLLEGVEADCVVADGTVYPLYSDENGEKYVYMADGVWYFAQKTEDGFVATSENYGGETEALSPTGNYYTTENEKVYIDPITIGSLTGTGGMGAIGKMSIVELLGEPGDNEKAEKILGDVTVENFMNGEVNLDEKINEILISDFVDVSADDKVMVFFAYGLSGLAQDESGAYTAIYKFGDEDIPVSVTVEDGKITSVTDPEGQPVNGLTVGNISTVSDKIDVSVFLDATAENKVVAYLAYGITDLQEGEDGSYTAKLKVGDEVKTVNVSVKDGKITGVTLAETGENVSAANISELNDRVDGVFNDLKIKDLVDAGDNKLLKKLGDYTLNNVDDGIDALELTDVLDVDANSAIMAYLAYGITSVNADEGTALLGKDTVYLEIEESEGKKIITGVYRSPDKEGEPEAATKINEINTRIDGIMEDLTLGELIEIDGSNTVLNALRNSTVNNLSEDINNLTINELYADEIYGGKDDRGETKNAVMKKAVGNSASQADEINYDSKYLYYELVSGEFCSDTAVYKLINAETKDKGKLKEFKTDKTYYTYGAPTKFWQLLVTVKTNSDGDGDENAYSLNGLTEMIDNIHNNMNYFTLSGLEEAGILKFGEEVRLDETKIPDAIEKYKGKTLGDLTVPDAIAAMVEIINKMNGSFYPGG